MVALEVGLDRATQVDQPRQLGGLDSFFERGVERTSESDVHPPAGGLGDSRACTNAGTFRKRTDTTRPSSIRATVASRPEGTSTTTSGPSTRPLSIAQVTSAIVP